ncbi:MAG: response regulator [Gammaproteobacteria bacterium]
MNDSDAANILVVDDLPENQLVYRTVLEELGQNLILARSGAEALRQVLEHEFAVILLDVNMPNMSGLETAAFIRQRKKAAHTPIIFITAYADEMQTAEGYALGAVDYMPSPVVPEVLRTKVKVFVELDRMRAALAQSHQLLEQRVAERTAELVASNERLQATITERRRAEEALKEAGRQKDEFLAMLAHELRNPLAPIRNAVQVLQRLELAEPRLDWGRAVIDRQVGQLTRLVDDLLDVSRLARGQISLKKEPVELRMIVERALETSRPMIEADRHHLSVALPSEPVCLEGDLTRLAQALGNLLNNAAKYTQEGGRIELTAEQAEDQVVLRVRDTGVGIPAETLPYVFDLFTQGDRALDRTQGGLGIGLALVKKLVELHGGQVEASSPGPGQGSEFTLRLPTHRGPPALVAAPKEPAAPAARLRILVVDDNADSAESMAMLLDLQGHETRSALDGPAALEAAQVFRPELILLDIGLPGMDGYEVARRLRTQPHMDKTVLVAMTGYGHQRDHLQAKAAGFNHHLVKPVDPGALQRVLASLTGGEAITAAG